MTREELTKQVGGEENAEYAMNLILKNIEPGFIRAILRSEKSAVEYQLKELEAEGFACMVNGSYHTDWGRESYDDTPEATEINSKLSSVEGLIYENNRLAVMMAVR
ncbi:MAG: hypothetical protein LUG99_08900 [Lachnospiraceae bacterium]|nr:hypothetical protein [Lachnospiraceae bacterium]